MTTTNNPYFYKQPCQDGGLASCKYEEETELAKQLRRRKLDQQSKNRTIQQVISESEEIKKLKQLVQLGYLNKERSKQLAEKQVRTINDLMMDAQLQIDLLKKIDQEQKKLKQIQAEKAKARLQSKVILEKQMQEKRLKEIQAHQQYLKEKDQVQRIIQTLLDADRKQLQMKDQKKKRAVEDMNTALQFKVLKKKQIEELEKMQTTKYMQYLKDLDKREEGVKFAKQEKQAAKQVIFQKLKAEEQKRRKEQQEFQNLKRQLYQEEMEAEIRRKNREQIEKKQRQKYQIQQAEVQAKERKRLQKIQEGKLQQQFRKTMLQKFANDDKLQQLAQQKRRIKEQQHKREVQRLWQQKLSAFRIQQQKQEQERKRVVQEQYWKQDIIRKQKQRIIRQNLPFLQGFAPKQLIKVSDGTYQSSGQIKRTGYADSFKLL